MFFSTNSSNSKNGHDPFSFSTDHSFHNPFSSPFEVDQIFDEYDLMFDHNFTPITTADHHPTHDLDKIDPTNTNTNTNMDSLSDHHKIIKKKIPRKRLSKKDRHSKITTARGLRDRRMRLSLPVARQFFGLQDMLGVDKGSKTVEWLLVQARSEILKLAKERNCSTNITTSSSCCCCSYSNSECEHNFVEKMKSSKSDGKKKKRVMKEPRKTMDKEMREMARARARARTMEKKNQMMMINIRDCSISNFDNNYQNHNKIASCSFETTGEESGTHSYNLNPAIEVEKPITSSQFGSSSSSSQPINIIDYNQLQNLSSFEIMAKWTPSHDSTFNYHHLHQTQNFHLQAEQNEFQDSNIFG